ncbi:MAG: hypothetical protein GX234_06650 [Clostridiales bacterium]|nr:hypothetical protein [Clostridiales bacterium]
MVKKYYRRSVIFLELLLCLLFIAGTAFYIDYSAKQDETPVQKTVSENAVPKLKALFPVKTTAEAEKPLLTETFSVSAVPLPSDAPHNFLTKDLAAAMPSIRLWKDETDGTYYLFLPSYAKNARLSVFSDLDQGIRIDGVFYHNGDFLTLETGTHILSDAEGTGEYPFEVLHSANIQTLYTHTESGSLDYLLKSKNNIESGAAVIIDSNGNPIYLGAMEKLTGHGNSSWLATDKRSFQITFPEQVNLFQMGAAKNWILVSNAFDPSMLRNYITYDLAAQIGLSYSPDAVFTDWYADGEYQGTYMLCEKVEVGKNRVAIADLENDTKAVNHMSESLMEFPRRFVGSENSRGSYKGFELENPADITGGYLISLELNSDVEPRYSNELSGFVTYRNQAVVVKRPACASTEQVEYIRNLYQSAEDAIMSENGINEETGFYYTHYIDVESFALKYIIEEITKNMDAQYSSQFFYKPEDSVSRKLFAGPVWDYDRAWGCSGTRVGVDLSDPETFYVNQYTYEGTLWYGLYQHDNFVHYVKSVFSKRVRPELQKTLDYKLDIYADQLSDSAVMNDYRWHVTEGISMKEKEKSYQKAVASVKDFGKKRLLFLEQEWCE